jgi:farnesyl-diphosphate farnesyltransferase
MIDAGQDSVAPSMTSKVGDRNDDELIDGFLQGTSRTFALAIPLLADERRRQIGLSYLLFRVADSIEDAPDADAELKCELLAALRNRFSQSLGSKSLGSQEQLLDPAASKGTQPTDRIYLGGLWPEHSPTGRLLLAFPRLMAIFDSLPKSVAQVVGQALTSTVGGMHSFIEASKGLPHQIQVQSLEDLRLYCYVVAGIVGEMLTDTFVCHHSCGQVVHRELRRLSVGFGEFLQLVNILKDSPVDAVDGRQFIPDETSRESVYQLAMVGREEAMTYVSLLASNGFPRDIILFCRFILMLAEGSLQKLRDGGAGSKLSRAEVMQILTAVRSESSFLPNGGLAEVSLSKDSAAQFLV